LKGGTLFDVGDRHYRLTPLGAEIFPEARELVAAAENWVNARVKTLNGLQHLSYDHSENWFFHQQHALGKALTSQNDMLREVIIAWATSRGNLGHDEMRKVRPVCNIFRRIQGNLVFAEVGRESAFARWVGPDRADSCVGLPTNSLPANHQVIHLLNDPYTEVENTHVPRLDHIHTVVPRGKENVVTPISYERLLLAAHFPDGSPAIVSVVHAVTRE
jgi:hypothetical protein